MGRLQPPVHRGPHDHVQAGALHGVLRGAPIFSGLREFFQTKFIVAGALAVALALIADALLVLLGRAVTPWTRARRPA